LIDEVTVFPAQRPQFSLEFARNPEPVGYLVRYDSAVNGQLICFMPVLNRSARPPRMQPIVEIAGIGDNRSFVIDSIGTPDG